MTKSATLQYQDDPLDQFADWYQQAQDSAIDKPHAMALSTTGMDQRPASRMVLLSSYDQRGFVFHTNYSSAKGLELARGPWVALLFWWDELGYQVRIEGEAEKTTKQESDAYFQGRPRGSQLGAWAAEQSQEITGRKLLEQRMAELEEQYEGQTVPRPPYWGGYRVNPQSFEFWQSRDDRLHDRVRYRLDNSGQWQTKILAP